MIAIKVDKDIYSHLIKNMTDFGDTPSSVLRRLLGLNPSTEKKKEEKTKIDQILEGTEFRYAKGVVGRFLVVLGKLHGIDKEMFSKVEKIQGRGRIYFAKDAETLHRSGRSVNPKKIPGTDYWVITTTPTDLKQDMLRKVMELYSFNREEIKIAVTAIAR